MRENLESLDRGVEKAENVLPDILKFKIESASKFDKIEEKGDPQYFEIGECIEIAPDDDQSYAASCVYHSVAGIVRTADNKTYVFQSCLDKLTDEQEIIINNSVSGIIGGGKTVLESFDDKFKDNNIEIIQPLDEHDLPDRYSQINLVVIQDKQNSEKQQAVCYIHENIKHLCIRRYGAVALNLCKEKMS